MIKDGTLIENTIYRPHEEKMIVKTVYDNTDVIDSNKRARNAGTTQEQYSGNLVLAARIHEGDVIRLKNLGYNLMSTDRDEWRRCLLYIQTHEPHLMRVRGKAFSKNRNIWE